MVRFLPGGTPQKTTRTYDRTHEGMSGRTSAGCATADKHTTHRCMRTMEAESLITWLD